MPLRVRFDRSESLILNTSIESRRFGAVGLGVTVWALPGVSLMIGMLHWQVSGLESGFVTVRPCTQRCVTESLESTSALVGAGKIINNDFTTRATTREKVLPTIDSLGFACNQNFIVDPPAGHISPLK